MYQTISQAILYGSCGAVRKFRCYVWSDCYLILSGYNQGRIDHKLDSISPCYNSPPDFGDARQEGWQQQHATHDKCKQI